MRHEFAMPFAGLLRHYTSQKLAAHPDNAANGLSCPRQTLRQIPATSHEFHVNRHKFWQFLHWPDHESPVAAKAILQRSKKVPQYSFVCAGYIPKAWPDKPYPVQWLLLQSLLLQYA